MKVATLFSAYQRVESRKDNLARRRGQLFGIAVGEDELAREWQRWDRLTRRIEARIYGVAVCPICTASDGMHYSTCPRSGIPAKEQPMK